MKGDPKKLTKSYTILFFPHQCQCPFQEHRNSQIWRNVTKNESVTQWTNELDFTYVIVKRLKDKILLIDD